MHICFSLSGMASKRSLMPWPASPPNSEDIETLQILWLGHLEQFFNLYSSKLSTSPAHTGAV